MAYIHKRGDRWNAVIRRPNMKSLSKTFDRKSDADKWAREEESKLDTGIEYAPVAMTFEQAVAKYVAEVVPTHKGARWEIVRFDLILNMVNFRLTPFQKVTDIDVQQWRDTRLTQVSGASVNREMNLISGLFTTAMKDWKIRMPNNPCSLVRRPKRGKARNRRISDAEFSSIMAQLNAPSTRILKRNIVGWMFEFAIETGMRCNEMCELQWGNVHRRYVEVVESKNGHGRNVPMSKRAREIMDSLRTITKKPFDISPGVVDVTFRKARDAAGIEDLHFHDTRHEACSRLAKRLGLLELAAVIGHKDLKSLQIYYNPTADELADKLDS